MTGSLIIVGCGGFGREVWSIVRALATVGDLWEVEGFVDDSPTEEDLERVARLGLRVIGSVADLGDRRSPYSAVIAIGSPSARRRVHAILTGSPVAYPRFVHPESTIAPPAALGVGVVVAPGARLSTNTTVGPHVHIDQNATVGHDSTIGEFARLNPHACVSGSVSIGSGVVVGANATILQGLRVGVNATVGAGSCVVRDVPEGAIVKGVPAR